MVRDMRIARDAMRRLTQHHAQQVSALEARVRCINLESEAEMERVDASGTPETLVLTETGPNTAQTTMAATWT